MSAVLELDHVSRVYGSGAAAVKALDDVSLTVDDGAFVAVMGASGSGKSTLLGIAGGLDQATSGTVSMLGEPLAGRSRDDLARLRRQSLGFVFQDFNLVPTLTAVENIALPLELDGVNAKQARVQALAALERVGLPELADRFIEQMSGGQRQRIAIARAIVGERRLVLADEPTGALDTTTSEEVMRLLRDLNAQGITIVLVTHEPDIAAWARRKIVVRDGRILEDTGVTA